MKKLLFILSLFISVFTFGQNTHVSGNNNGTIWYADQNGLKGDSSTDNLLPMRALLAKIPDGASIYFGKGYYLFSDSLLINKSITIFSPGKSYYALVGGPGQGVGGGYLAFTSATKSGLCIHASGTNVSPIVHLHDISIVNLAGTQPSAGNGISISDDVAGLNIENCTVLHFYDNINVIAGLVVQITKNEIAYATHASIVLGNNVNPDNGAYHIADNHIQSGTTTGLNSMGLYFKGGGGVTIHHNFFNSANGSVTASQFLYPIYADFSQGQTSDVTISDNFIENYQPTGSGIYMRNYSSHVIYNTVVSNNEIAPEYTGASIVAPAIFVANYNGILINNNYGLNLTATSNSAFLRIDSAINCSVIPGFQQGWTKYESDTNSGAGVFIYGQPTQSVGNTGNIQYNNGPVAGFNTFGGTDNFTFSNTGPTLTMGGASSANTTAKMQIQNGNAGNAARSGFFATDGSNYSIVGQNSTNFTAYGALVGGAGYYYSSALHSVLMHDNGSGELGIAVGSVPVVSAKWTAGGLYTAAAPTSGMASINYPAGTAPSSPNDGDTWNNSSTHILESRINGITLRNGAVVGQTTLISGTKAVTITGLTTGGRAFVTLVTPSGVTSTVQYQAVCTSNTLTIQANVAAGTINASDGSTLNYQVYP